MLKACSRCGGIHNFGEVCPKKLKRVYSKTEENKLRSRYSWKIKRASIKESANYLCEVCKDKGDYTPKPLEVHHIIKLANNSSGLLEDNNLIALCVKHHKEADRGELSIEYLRELSLKRDSFL